MPMFAYDFRWVWQFIVRFIALIKWKIEKSSLGNVSMACAQLTMLKITLFGEICLACSSVGLSVSSSMRLGVASSSPL